LLGLSALINLPQFQGLINLAQTNPGLFNQLTNSSYFDLPNYNTAAPVTTSATTSNSSSSTAPVSIAAAMPAPTTGTHGYNTDAAMTTSNNNTNKFEPVLTTFTNNTTSSTATPAVQTPTTAEELESSLRILASELGFDPSKFTGSDLDYVNMDDFLNTYSK
jgi:hypothetical protein